MNLPETTPPPRWSRALLCWATGTLSLAWFATTVLSSSLLASSLMSHRLWLALVNWCGASPTMLPDETLEADLGLYPFIGTLAFSIGTLFVGTLIASRRSLETTSQVMRRWAAQWKWWWGFLLWQALWIGSLIGEMTPFVEFSVAVIPFWLSMFLACWLSGLSDANASQRRQLNINTATPLAVSLGVALFVTVWTTMNWQLYAGLLTPHGDSAMYEEHLWNVTHGKGFRSYLDQGLFLGEHIQVIHLLFVPLYLLWPSHLLLELLESLALALTAFPVYWIALRHSGSPRAARWMALSVLLYFPLHFLEIAIDLKTFRPISFGVPLMLMVIDQWERRRWKTAFFVFVPLTLACKEDFAAILAPLGLWLAWDAWTSERDRDRVRKGIALSAFSVAYLVFVIKFAIPAFRSGDDVHYSRYFGELGSSPGDIVRTFIDSPGVVAARLFRQRTLIYALALLVPLAGLPLRSMSRLCVGLPLFAILSLMQLSEETGSVATDMLIPFHHFHAPLLPILFWAAAGSLNPREHYERHWSLDRFAASACAGALFSGIWFSLSPLGIAFWDPYSSHYFGELYVPGERAKRIDAALAPIPVTARVASTDYVHPRLTHYERSYDYSQYPRKVAGYDKRVPDDTDFIVIDTRHRYSWIHAPEDVPELREEPEKWELLPDTTDGYFLVLKRKQEVQP